MKALEKKELRVLRLEGELASLRGHLQAAQEALSAGRRPAIDPESVRAQLAHVELLAAQAREEVEASRARSRR